MLLNSTAKILSSSQMPVVEESSFDASLKDNFDHYKACAIKLHLLADSCPEDPSEQAELERIQAECIKGQILGRASNVSFQQIQKYELGQTRITVGRLWNFCEVLDVSPTYFFEGLETVSTPHNTVGDTFTADKHARSVSP